MKDPAMRESLVTAKQSLQSVGHSVLFNKTSTKKEFGMVNDNNHERSSFGDGLESATVEINDNDRQCTETYR